MSLVFHHDLLLTWQEEDGRSFSVGYFGLVQRAVAKIYCPFLFMSKAVTFTEPYQTHESGGDTSAEPVRNPTSLLNFYDAKLGMTFLLLFGGIQL